MEHQRIGQAMFMSWHDANSQHRRFRGRFRVSGRPSGRIAHQSLSSCMPQFEHKRHSNDSGSIIVRKRELTSFGAAVKNDSQRSHGSSQWQSPSAASRPPSPPVAPVVQGDTSLEYRYISWIRTVASHIVPEAKRAFKLCIGINLHQQLCGIPRSRT